MEEKSWRNKKRTRNQVLDIMFDSPEVIFFDCETTGLNPKEDYIIELAAYKYEIGEGTALRLVDTMDLFIKPPFAVSEKIVELTGITNEMLYDKPSAEEEFEAVDIFFGNTPVLAGYNSSRFDVAFLQNWYVRCGKTLDCQKQIDVLDMARDCVQGLPNYKLKTVADALGVSDNIQFHSAKDDAAATKALFEIFYNGYFTPEEESGERGIRPEIFGIRFWKGYRGYSRIYVETSAGNVYYSPRKKCWYGDAVDQIDMEYLEEKSFELTKTSNESEFSRFSGQLSFA